MIRVLVVDDSPTFRRVLRDLFVATGEVVVVGEAADGEEALAQALRLKPDVITMDVRMPRRDGLAAIADIMARQPTPIIVVCAGADEPGVDLSLQALRLGAVDVLAKPHDPDPVRFAAQSQAIQDAVRGLAARRLSRPPPSAPAPALVARPARPAGALLARPKVLGIVASTGGPTALARILGGLPRDYPVPVLVVQHIVDGFSRALARWLADQCALKVELATHRQALEPGTALLAPDGHHLMVSVGRVRLDPGPPVSNLRPSGTVLLASLAKEYGAEAAGLVLTGMGDDGAAGLKAIRDRGGYTAAQGPRTSVVYGMPRVALETGAAEQTLELEEITPALRRLAGVHAPVTRPKLLLVDDTETILQLERQLFEAAYDLVLARNGKEAVELCEQHLPAAVLMDYSMPIMNGGEALRAMKASPRTKAVPVVIVTSERDPALLQSVRDSGCHALLPKPIDRQLLQETVRRLVPS